MDGGCLIRRDTKMKNNKISMEKKLKELRKIIIPVLRRNDVIKAGLFGSVARGEDKRKSDIDILIEFKGRKSLFDLASLEIELEKNGQESRYFNLQLR